MNPFRRILGALGLVARGVLFTFCPQFDDDDSADNGVRDLFNPVRNDEEESLRSVTSSAFEFSVDSSLEGSVLEEVTRMTRTGYPEGVANIPGQTTPIVNGNDLPVPVEEIVQVSVGSVTSSDFDQSLDSLDGIDIEELMRVQGTVSQQAFGQPPEPTRAAD